MADLILACNFLFFFCRGLMTAVLEAWGTTPDKRDDITIWIRSDAETCETERQQGEEFSCCVISSRFLWFLGWNRVALSESVLIPGFEFNALIVWFSGFFLQRRWEIHCRLWWTREACYLQSPSDLNYIVSRWTTVFTTCPYLKTSENNT